MEADHEGAPRKQTFEHPGEDLGLEAGFAGNLLGNAAYGPSKPEVPRAFCIIRGSRTSRPPWSSYPPRLSIVLRGSLVGA